MNNELQKYKADFESVQTKSIIVPIELAQYKEQLQVGGVIQRSLVEFCKFVNKGKK